MSSTADYMIVTFQCINPECPWLKADRSVRLQHLGQGLYLDSPVRCECGHYVAVVGTRIKGLVTTPGVVK